MKNLLSTNTIELRAPQRQVANSRIYRRFPTRKMKNKPTHDEMSFDPTQKQNQFLHFTFDRNNYQKPIFKSHGNMKTIASIYSTNTHHKLITRTAKPHTSYSSRETSHPIECSSPKFSASTFKKTFSFKKMRIIDYISNPMNNMTRTLSNILQNKIVKAMPNSSLQIDDSDLLYYRKLPNNTFKQVIYYY